jgi:hypothetical protein
MAFKAHGLNFHELKRVYIIISKHSFVALATTQRRKSNKRDVELWVTGIKLRRSCRIL